ncbi:glycoside hydrolase family 95 protein, partial [uncultured Duncaniella sp.]
MKLFAKSLIFAGVFVLSLNVSAGQVHKLWYDTPAQVWTEALPLGNGRLGAMVYGNPANEQIQLNEETIWAGRPNNNANPEAREWIPKIRKLVFEGRYREAQDMCTAHVKSATNQGMPYQPFGDLRISFPGHGRYDNYYRELSLDSARTVVRYSVDGVNYTRETFASFPDQVVITRITSDRPGSVTFNASLTTPHPDVMIASEGDEITLSGISSNHEGLKGKVEFQGRVTAVPKGGRMTSRDGVITVENADEAVIYTSIATNFNNYKDITADEEARAKEYLHKAVAKPYAQAKKEHVDFYQKEIGSSSLDLGPDMYADVPTDKRIERFAETNDNHLVANYYKFGRYLLVSSSQPGCQPANLQGIWNDKMFPSWDSKYTCNINLEMNYWPSEVTGLTHLNEPLFRLIREVSETGAETARIMYDAPGWVLHHNTDIWRVTGAIDNAPSGMWMSGGAWLCRHLWEHYLHTGDMEFLSEAYPIMKGAGEFFDATMVYEPKSGKLVVCPSNSPENAPKGHNATTVAGATMDNQLVTELWNNIITAATILDTDKEFADRLKSRVKEISPMRIGHWGQLQEWMGDWDDP